MASSHERYAPMYWLQRWNEATGNGEHELALGYAHLALILCQEVYFALHPDCGKPPFIDSAIRNAIASFHVDGNNYVENEHSLYFEGLKLLALRSIMASLLAIGYFGEALNVIEVILNPRNWLVELSNEERVRLAESYHDSVKHQAEKLKLDHGGKTYLRHDTWLWKTPYDVDTSTAEGISRLGSFILHSSRPKPQTPKQPKVQIAEGLCFIRDLHGKPSLRTSLNIAAGEVIWAEGTALAVTSTESACEYCLVAEEFHIIPQPIPPSCCTYAEMKMWPPCCTEAGKLYHLCQEYDEAKEDQLHDAVLGHRIADFGHAVLLIQRVLQYCKHAANVADQNGPRVHPLQVDIIPFLPSDCERLIPWSYRHGIVEVLQMLLNEGINIFLDDDWDIRTILILWRKLGPLDWHLITDGVRKIKIGNYSVTTGNLSGVYPTYPFLQHSCRPNAKLRISPTQPTVMRLRATRDISAGEQITVSRIDVKDDGSTPYTERAEAFEAVGMGRCNCAACVEDAREEYKAKNPVNKDLNFKDADAELWAPKLAARQAAIEAFQVELAKKMPKMDADKEQVFKLYETEELEEQAWKTQKLAQSAPAAK